MKGELYFELFLVFPSHLIHSLIQRIRIKEAQTDSIKIVASTKRESFAFAAAAEKIEDLLGTAHNKHSLIS